MYRQLPLVHEPQHASLVLLALILVFEQLLSVPIFWAEEHAQLKFRAWCSNFGPGTLVSNGTALTCYGQYPLI
jgi:hypothetical protein